MKQVEVSTAMVTHAPVVAWSLMAMQYDGKVDLISDVQQQLVFHVSGPHTLSISAIGQLSRCSFDH
jgi:hypothetical protein